MQRIDLGKEQWADVLDVEDVPRRAKKRAQEWALNRFHKGEDHPGQIMSVTHDILMAYVVVNWSFGDAPNGDPERVGDLPTYAYDRLAEATEEHYKDLDFMRTSDSSSDSKTTSEDSPSPATSPTPDTSAP